MASTVLGTDHFFFNLAGGWGGRVGKFAHANIFYIYMRLHVANIFCVTPSSCKHFKFLLACNLFQKIPPHPEWSVPNYMVMKQ